MSQFNFNVGDKITEQPDKPERFIVVEWLGDGVFAGVNQDGQRQCYFKASGYAWRMWSPPVSRWIFDTEWRKPVAGDIYVNGGGTTLDFCSKAGSVFSQPGGGVMIGERECIVADSVRKDSGATDE